MILILLQEGENNFMVRTQEGVGIPDYHGERGLPFLKPWSIPDDPGFFIGKEMDEFGNEAVAPYGPCKSYMIHIQVVRFC